MKRSHLVFAVLATLATYASAAQTTPWSFVPYSNEVTDLKVKTSSSASPLIWIGSNHGVTRIQGTDTLRLNSVNSTLPNVTVSSQDIRSAVYHFGTATALDSVGNYWIAYNFLNKVVRISPSGIITTFDSSATTPWHDIQDIVAGKNSVYVGLSNGVVYAGNNFALDLSWKPITSGVSDANSQALYSLGYGALNNTLWMGFIGDANGNLKYIHFDKDSSSHYFSTTSFATVTPTILRIWVPANDTVPFLEAGGTGMYGTITVDSLLAPYAKHIYTVDNAISSRKYYAYLGNAGSSEGDLFIRNDTLVSVGYSGNASVGMTGISLSSASVSISGMNVGAVLDTVVSGSFQLLLGKSSSISATSLPAAGFFQAKVPKNDVTWKLDSLNYEAKLAGTTIVASVATGSSLWLATNAGLYYLATDTSTPALKYIPATGSINTISLDSAGSLWIGQSNGAYLYNGDGTATQKGPKDSVYAITHTKSYGGWFYSRTGTSAHLYNYTTGASTWPTVSLTGIGADSLAINKLRVYKDGTPFALSSNSYLYVFGGVSWSKYKTTNVKDFELDSKIVATSKTSDGTYAWTLGNIVGTSLDTLIGTYTAYAPIKAMDSTSLWTLDTAIHALRTSGDSLKLDSLWPLPLKVFTYSYCRVLENDPTGGVWLVGTRGILHMNATTSTTLPPSGISSLAAQSFARIAAGKLQFSLAEATDVHLQILSLDGRVLEQRSLGNLSAGSHTVTLSKQSGMNLLRIKAGKETQTLRLMPF